MAKEAVKIIGFMNVCDVDVYHQIDKYIDGSNNDLIPFCHEEIRNSDDQIIKDFLDGCRQFFFVNIQHLGDLAFITTHSNPQFRDKAEDTLRKFRNWWIKTREQHNKMLKSGEESSDEETPSDKEWCKQGWCSDSD